MKADLPGEEHRGNSKSFLHRYSHTLTQVGPPWESLKACQKLLRAVVIHFVAAGWKVKLKPNSFILFYFVVTVELCPLVIENGQKFLLWNILLSHWLNSQRDGRRRLLRLVENNITSIHLHTQDTRGPLIDFFSLCLRGVPAGICGLKQPFSTWASMSGGFIVHRLSEINLLRK